MITLSVPGRHHESDVVFYDSGSHTCLLLLYHETSGIDQVEEIVILKTNVIISSKEFMMFNSSNMPTLILCSLYAKLLTCM